MTANEKTGKVWTGNEIRETFLRFFESKGHRRVRSSSLVPHGDPTLLFTNAGMNQFKDVFLGLEKRDYNKATTAQKCVRAGGKHNDLENVGFTKRHHTFFEMMGNFSFGDYFKEKAIPYAWELLTSPDWFAIPKDKLYVTVFGGAEVAPGNTLGVDEDARQIWLKENVPAERIIPIPGLKDNFWAMGDTGPCGPCSEIFYDMGPAASEEGHADCQFPCDCGRYVEIWNLVFMQFNRDASGTLTPLPKPCVDTGMGLERVAAVLQHVISNYDTDLFTPLTKRAAELCGVDLQKEEKLEEGKGGAASLRVIADHTRATTFLISDGVLPSNEGRGYVLRKIMRRAIRHGRQLGASKPFLAEMAETVRHLMGAAYPELLQPAAARVPEIVQAEEKRFSHTLDIGLKHLIDDLFQKGKIALQSDIAEQRPLISQGYQAAYARGAGMVGQPIISYPGDKAFRLYDTYGLPLDFIRDVVRDAGLQFDEQGFESAMAEQRARARASWKGGAKEKASPAYAKIAETFRTEKDFYHGTTAKDCRIEAILTKSGPVNELKAGESGEVVLDRTTIYAESGGQVADTGGFYDNTNSQLLAEVTGAYYPVAGLVAHKVVAKETLRVGDRVCVDVDTDRHARIIRNHSGTHLVHAALCNILGTHVKQAGSLNAPDRLRFDFSYFAHVDAEELRDIEQQVNEEIRLNTQIETNVTSLEDALASGALAFFGDKYPEHNVRVVTIPDPRAARGFYSKELCGGTHVTRVGDIGVLKIVSEESVAAGVRRIEAVTGIGAIEYFQKLAALEYGLRGQVHVEEESVERLRKFGPDLIGTHESWLKSTQKQLEEFRRKEALRQIDELATLIRESREQVAREALVKGNSQVHLIKGIKVAWSQVQDVNRQQLREILDKLRQEIRSGVVVLASVENGDISLIAGVTKDLTAKVHAGKLIQALVKQVGGKGGGRPDLAEGGGENAAGLKTALETVPSLIEPLL